MQEVMNTAQAKQQGAHTPFRSETMRRVVRNPMGSRAEASTPEEGISQCSNLPHGVHLSAIVHKFNLASRSRTIHVQMQVLSCLSTLQANDCR